MTNNLVTEIKLTLPGQSEPIVFDNPDSLLKWLGAEEEQWKWFLDPSRSDNILSSFWNNTTSQWNKIRTMASGFSASTESDKPNIIRNIQSRLTDLYVTNRWSLPSNCPRAQYVLKLKDNNPREAAWTLLAFLRPQEVRPSSMDAVQGIVRAFLFDQGLVNESLAAERSTLDAASRDWNDLLNKSKSDLKRANQEYDNVKSEVSTLKDNQQAHFAKLIDQTEKTLKSIEETYDKKLSLQAPVIYWTNKAKTHLRLSIAFSFMWIILASASVWAVWWEVEHFLFPMMNESVSEAANPDPNKNRAISVQSSKGKTSSSEASKIETKKKDQEIIGIEHWRYLIIFATVSLLLWPLRFIARLINSNIHLHQDARERETMSNTYLSLLRSKEGLPEGDRRLILESLFRPAATGIVRDDAPHTTMQLISRLGSGDRK